MNTTLKEMIALYEANLEEFIALKRQLEKFKRDVDERMATTLSQLHREHRVVQNMAKLLNENISISEPPNKS